MSAHNEYPCATKGCGHVVCLTPTLEERLRRTHESFYCPAGHSMSFSGQSAQERRIAELEKALATRTRWQQDTARRLGGLWAELREYRQASKVCPFECGYTVKRVRTWPSIRARMSTHLIDVHGADVWTPEETARWIETGERPARSA